VEDVDDKGDTLKIWSIGLDTRGLGHTRAANGRGVKIWGVEFEGEQGDFATAPAALEGAAADIVLPAHVKLVDDAPVEGPSR
jgi:hypothetical protein